MSRRRVDSDDLARVLFAASEGAGVPVPREQTTFVLNEIGRLVGEREIVGFAESLIDGQGGYVFAILDSSGFLLRWEEDDLQVTFLGRLRNLRYRELTHDRQPFYGAEGELVLRVEVEQEQLPGTLSFEIAEWMMSQFSGMRRTLREWAEA